MELFSVSISGYRRFKRSTTLRTVGKVLAILGPNEAGKSSLLRAISHLGDDAPLEASVISRGMEAAALEIVGKFTLTDEELAATNLTGPRWMTVTKLASGGRSWGFEPKAPLKDSSHRIVLANSLNDALKDDDFRLALELVDSSLPENINKWLKGLVDAPEIAPKALLDQLAMALSSLNVTPLDSMPNKVRSAIAEWKSLAQREKSPTPAQAAANALWKNIPQFLFFDDASRDLKTSYSIDILRSEIPVALDNLAKVADLDFPTLLSALDSRDNSAVATIEHKANRNLDRRFGEAWKQSQVNVALRIAESVLEIQVIDENTEFTAFAERSDGLRQFVALQSFVTRNRANDPILLIDEAEQRLHYDAQADLVQMFAKQTVSPKVIYTTHSAGCLPEDLGSGVRLIQKTGGDATASEIKNKFWAIEGDGFAPLLFGMGASTLAFFPTRRAVMVEGPVDMLLYPSMFREALGLKTLGFQFVPGLAIAEHPMTPLLLRHEKGVCYLVDGDGGGSAIKLQLRNKGVAEEAIVLLKNANSSAVEIEDYIRPDILLAGANKLISTFFPDANLIAATDISADRRMSSLEAAYRANTGVPIPKVELAYEVLTLYEDAPGSTLLDARRKRSFESIASTVVQFFVSQSQV